MGAFEKLCKKAARDNPISFPEKDKSSSSLPLIDTRRLISFQREYAAAQDYAGKYRVLRVRWLEVARNQQMPDFHQEILSALIGYRYLAIAYAEKGLMMPINLVKNLEALEQGDISKMRPHMSRMMTILTQTNTNRGEEEMVKNTEAKKGSGVSHLYLEIFENQGKAKLTDEAIANTIETATGTLPTLKNVASYRCMYNAGKLHGQKACPKDKVKAVRISKAKPKKPMSEETKAKLKKYTADKKAAKAKIAKKK